MAFRYDADVCKNDRAKYAEYIKIHLDNYKAKCDRLSVCINKLLSTQNPISVLQGDNVSLKKICKLINVEDNNSTSSMLDGKCTVAERMDMMKDVENHIEDKMEKRKGWEDVAICLENEYGDNERTTYGRDICRLAEKSTTICNNFQTHKHVEKFVNEQIEHLDCTCKSLHRDVEADHSHLPISALVGIGAGGVFLLFTFFIAIYCCWRRQRNKRKKKKGPNVIYLPAPNADNCPVYQEIGLYDQRSPGVQPSLPSRYVSRPLPGNPEEAEYLEPINVSNPNSYRSKAPPPLQRLVDNPSYELDAPPKYSVTDNTYEDAILINDNQNNYIDPIPTPKSGGTLKSPTEAAVANGMQSYDVLDQAAKEGESHAETYQALMNDGAHQDNDNGDDMESLPGEYQPLEDVDSDVNVPLGPAPSERTKKEDRVTESEYFELESEKSQEVDGGDKETEIF